MALIIKISDVTGREAKLFGRYSLVWYFLNRKDLVYDYQMEICHSSHLFVK